MLKADLKKVAQGRVCVALRGLNIAHRGRSVELEMGDRDRRYQIVSP